MALGGSGVSRVTTYSSYASGSTNAYIPALFAKKMLRRFYAESAYELIANTDYEGEIKKQGDQVIIRKAPLLTINDYTAGRVVGQSPDGTLTYEVPAATFVELNIDTAKYWAFQIDDIDELASDLPLMNEFTSNAAMQLQVVIDRDVLLDWATETTIPTANKGAAAGAISGDIDLGVTTNPVDITGGSTGNAVDFLVDCNQVLDEQNIPNEGRWAVLPSWYIAKLKTGDLRRADVTGDGTGTIRSGVVGMIDKFMIIQNNNLPNGSAAHLAAGEFNMLFGTKEAATFAMQLTKTETLRIPDSFGEYARGLCVYGKQVVQPTAIGVGIIAAG
jgi:hypothetical protein